MVTHCWAAKGGSGATVVTATLAITARPPTLLVDLDGDVPGVLGVAEPDRPGVVDWLTSEAPAQQLGELVVDVGGVCVLPYCLDGRGASPADVASGRWRDLGGWLCQQEAAGTDVFIDGGTRTPHPELLGASDRSLLVTRACYLALRRATRCGVRPTGVILVDEPGRALSRRDVEYAIGAPVVATVSIDPAVARVVDAGLLTCRLPRVIRRELRSAAVAA